MRAQEPCLLVKQYGMSVENDNIVPLFGVHTEQPSLRLAA